jgi:nitroreductase/NAD-dependent dihydropyrimidine dehydrogenase PreA subunit
MTEICMDRERCIACGACVNACPLRLYRARNRQSPNLVEGAEEYCIGCGHCLAICPQGVISLDQVDPADCQEAIEIPKERFDRFASLVKSRRSIRRFEQRPLEFGHLEQLFDLLRWAPSARNQQKVEWLVLNNQDKVHDLASQVAAVLEANDKVPSMVQEWKKGIDVFHRGAPCLAIAHIPDEAWGPTVDCVIAAEILDLASFVMGIGSCWAGILIIAATLDSSIAERLEIPVGHSIQAAMMLGYPEERYLRIPPRPESRVRLIV